MSEDAAYRRVAAARLVKRFPLLLGAIERGELHLTGILQLGPHLTETNLVEVLARAQFRTQKEIETRVACDVARPNDWRFTITNRSLTADR